MLCKAASHVVHQKAVIRMVLYSEYCARRLKHSYIKGLANF
ncbi:hypothetical protein QWZ13_08750 [Reinekea marina]|nr:hypothetical protein [Reinekea marina]MDN3648998.1 hypothetical protein [Reinekea marina]